jgi:hypothetical protein
VYLFSADPGGEKVTHVNFLPKAVVSKEFDARVWATKVSSVLGGKVSLSPLLYMSVVLIFSSRVEERKILLKVWVLTSIRFRRRSRLHKIVMWPRQPRLELYILGSFRVCFEIEF